MSLQQVREAESGLRKVLASLLVENPPDVGEMLDLAGPVVQEHYTAVSALAHMHAGQLGLDLGAFRLLLWKPELILDEGLTEPIELFAMRVLGRVAAFHRFCSEELGQHADAVLATANPALLSFQGWLMNATGLAELTPDPEMRETHYELLRLFWAQARTLIRRT